MARPTDPSQDFPAMRQALPFCFILVALESCAPSQCFQVFTTAPTSESLVNDDLTYSNDDVTITFDFWSEGGHGGFQVLNKTTSNLVLNLDTTFLAVNGGLDVFFDNSSYAISKSQGTSNSRIAAVTNRLDPNYAPKIARSSATRGTLASSVTSSASSGVELTQKENNQWVVPPGFSTNLYESNIFDTSLQFCELQRNPYGRRRDGETLFKSFTQTESPVKFDFVVNYSIGQRTEQLVFSFYVKEVTNYKKSEMFTYVREDPCGKLLNESYVVPKNPDPSSFYNTFFVGWPPN